MVKDGFAEGRYQDVPAGKGDVRLVLPASGRITGRVTRVNGTPAAGVLVTVIARCTYVGNARSWPSPEDAPNIFSVADSGGIYTLEQFSPCEAYDIGVYGKSQAELRGDWTHDRVQPLAYKQHLHVDGGDTLSGVDLQIPDNPYVRISGFVRDEETGRPIQRGFGVGCFVLDPFRSLGRGETSADGTYRLVFTLNDTEDVSFGGTYISQQGRTSAPIKRVDDGKVDPIMTVSPGDELAIDFTAEAPVTIPVRVVDSAEQPLPGLGIGVGALQDTGVQLDFGVGCVSDANGQALLTGLVPRGTYFVWVQENPEVAAPGAKPVRLAESGPLDPAPGGSVPEVVLVVDVEGGFEGILTDEQGNPLRNASISIAAQPSEPGEPASAHGRTNPDGSFTLVHALPPGTYSDIVFTATVDTDQYVGRAENVEVVRDAIVDLGRITLTPDTAEKP